MSEVLPNLPPTRTIDGVAARKIEPFYAGFDIFWRLNVIYYYDGEHVYIYTPINGVVPVNGLRMECRNCGAQAELQNNTFWILNHGDNCEPVTKDYMINLQREKTNNFANADGLCLDLKYYVAKVRACSDPAICYTQPHRDYVDSEYDAIDDVASPQDKPFEPSVGLHEAFLALRGTAPSEELQSDSE